MKLSGSKRPPADAWEAANWWSARRRLGLLSEREEAALAEWLKDPEHFSAWAVTEAPLTAIGEFASAPEIRSMRDAALKKRSSRSLWFWILGGGASLAAGIALTTVWFQSPLEGTDSRGRQIAASAPLRYATRVGERREIALTDGSRIALNTNSVLEVTFSERRRNVRLLSGQALFRVAKDEGRPFVVSAGDRRITATGTAFDVRVGDTGGVTVLLVEGRVSVDPIRREGLARIIPALEREAIEPGERLTAEPAKPVSIATADVERGTSWSQGRIIFRDDTLTEAVAEMNRYSTTRLVIDDDRLGRLRISGVFRSANADNFTAMLATAYPIDAQAGGPGVVVLKWKEGRGK